MIAIGNMAGSGGELSCAKAIIKLGSGVVIGRDRGVDAAVLEGLADALVDLKRRGVQVIIVTSGAIGAGCSLLNRPRPKTLPEKQALAAVGQISLMRTYQTIFAERGLTAAQLLLTRGDMEDRRRYLNARYTLERLLELGAIPIINENDTTATDEISFGDNDMLSAFIAVKMKADLLILLSTAEGVLGPGSRTSELVPVIPKIDEETLGWARAERSAHGTGGMRSKLEAARAAAEAGVHVVIAGGKTPGIIGQIFSGQFRGTYIPAARRGRLSARARWIGLGRRPRGQSLVLDAGAVEAILRKKTSLLPVGVAAVWGEFQRGDLVDLCDARGRAIARGLVNYSSEEIEKIKGLKTPEISSVLGDRNYDEIVHRDNMAILVGE